MKTLSRGPREVVPRTTANPSGRNWGVFFKRTMVLVFLFSVSVHLLLLIGFGGMTLFKGRVAKMPFTAERIGSDKIIEAPAPPSDEPPSQETSPSEPTPQEMAEPMPESAPLPQMMTVPGGSSWAPALSKASVGSPSEASKPLASGGGTPSQGVKATGIKLFGVEVRAKKLGVIVDISKSMQKYTPQLAAEIFEKFPDADVIFTNGGGMMDWSDALKKFNDGVEEEKKKAKETKKDYRGPTKMEKPVLSRFNASEAADWVPIRGSKINHESYRGLKEDYPELYDKLSKRGNAWFVSSFQDANAVYLAFQELIRRKVEAIYWFSDFECPVEGKEAEKVASAILENQIEVILHSPKGLPKPSSLKLAEPWATQVQAKLVRTNL